MNSFIHQETSGSNKKSQNKIHCVPKKWLQNRNHDNYDKSYLSELDILLAAVIIAFLVQTLQITTKSTAQFSSNSCLNKKLSYRRETALQPV